VAARPDGEIVIVAGDADYFDLVGDAKAEGWPVRVVCCKAATAEIVRSLPEFTDLTQHLKSVGFFERYEVKHDFGEVDWSKVVPYHDAPRAPPRPKGLPKGRVR
jgi:hypothetical protein